MILKDQSQTNIDADRSVERSQSNGPIFKDAAPCFTEGTRIVALGGEELVEDIQTGDQILIADHGFQTVRWVGRRHVSQDDLVQYPQLRPYIINKGAFGNQRDLRVSPQHGMACRIGGKETLLRAKNVGQELGLDAAVLDLDCKEIVYFHILFDQHELVFAEGALSEAYFPGPSAIGSLDQDARDELLFLFPEHHDIWTSAKPTHAVFGRPARSYYEPDAIKIAA